MTVGRARTSRFIHTKQIITDVVSISFRPVCRTVKYIWRKVFVGYTLTLFQARGSGLYEDLYRLSTEQSAYSTERIAQLETV